MAEISIRTDPLDRGTEQAIVALKKGAQLLKYRRRGKPKFCSIRLSADEKFLIWYSGKEEKQLKLNSVTKIIAGQRTVNFQRQPQPEKESQSFSLIYKNGERSLDLICKDKEQAESWFVGLTALVSSSRLPKPLANLRCDRVALTCGNSPVGHTRRKHNLGLVDDSAKFSQVHSLCGSPPRSLVERDFSDGSSYSSESFYSSQPRTLSNMQSITASMLLHSPHLELDYLKEKMRETNPTKGYRIGLPSAISPSTRSFPSMDKNDVLKDVLMWGEGIEGGILGGGINRLCTSDGTRFDALLPKLLESTSMLDVCNISCGRKHAALVTRQGEVFCWGEENGGRLGHKIKMDVSCPKVVESLIDVHVESIACGEYNTCALTVSGELYTWGDSGHGVGLSGSESNGNWWLPRKISGPLDGVCISSVACGEWHTAVVSSLGQLFTYGDGTFGVLGHGNLQSTSQPKEVESLKGLKVKSVACGPWHTAAIVEILIDHFKGKSPGGKLFTWGDGDKGRLGHTDKEKKLVPSCVASLVDHDFVQVSCGTMLTVALTVTGIVCTMGSMAHGQLGNPQADDRSIAIVEGKLQGEFVKGISSGSYHVAVLTSNGNIYTWGKGANGRLGLGDTEDRNSPALVEALKDRQVQSVSCGSSFTSVICLHKSISSSDQSICGGCRMIFGFTRKKHNCYNCGFVFCHACSSKKATNASLAPNKSKQYRVCDPCFIQLRNLVDSRLKDEILSPRQPMATRKAFMDLKVEREEATVTRSQLFSPKLSSHEQSKYIEGQTLSKQSISPFLTRPPRWGQVPCPILFSTYGGENPMMFFPPTKDQISSISSVYGQQSPPRSKSLVPYAKSLENGLTESEKMLTEEVERLRAEAKSLAKQCQMKNEKIQQCQQRIEETWLLARDEVAKCKAAKEVIRALTARMNTMTEKFSVGRDTSNITSILADKVDRDLPQITPVCTEPMEFEDAKTMFGRNHLSPDVRTLKDRQINGLCSPLFSSYDMLMSAYGRDQFHGHTESTEDSSVTRIDSRQNVTKAVKADWVEQDEPGVYITFATLPNGQKGLKRVRFSRKRFSEKEAERWWEENELRVYKKYDVEANVSASRNKMNS